MEDDLTCVIEENKLYWGAYLANVVQRQNLIDWYFKVVALPASIVGYVAATGPGGATISNHVSAALLLVIFLTGLVLYITYAKESSNACKYERALVVIRDFLGKRMPTLKDVLIIDELRGNKRSRSSLGSIKLWRGWTLVIINSAIAVACVGFLFPPFNWARDATIYVISAIVHLLFYWVMSARYKASVSI